MFKLIENPEFTHDVTVVLPVDGGFAEQTFKARFKLMDTEEIAAQPVSNSFSSENAAFLRKAIVGLEDLTGEDNKPLLYNDDLRDKVLKSPPAQMALMRTYLDAISRVKQGN